MKTTKFIGVKEFRASMADIAKKARSGSVRYIVMNHNKPLFEVKAFAEDVYLDSFVASMIEANADAEAGRLISHDELVKELGIT